ERGVKDVDERALAAALHRVDELEVALRLGVERDVVVGLVALDAADVRDAALLGLAEVVERGAGGDEAEGQVLDAVALERVRLEVAQQRLVGEIVPEDPVLLRRE